MIRDYFNNRYFKIKAIEGKDDNLIPFWLCKMVINERYECEYEDFVYDGKTYESPKFVDCTWDSMEQKIVPALFIECRPKHTTFKVGENVTVEVDYSMNNVHRQVKLDEIVDIEYVEEEISYYTTEDMDWFYDKYHTDVEREDIPPSVSLFGLKMFKPVYILSSGEQVEHEYKLHHIV